jgi:hypothetical protein
MKKRGIVILGLPTALLAFSLVLTGCPDTNGKEEEANTDPKKITITNISGLPEGTTSVSLRVFKSYEYPAAYVGNHPKNTALAYFSSYSAQTALTFSLKTPTSDNSYSSTSPDWTGNGTYYIYFLPGTSTSISTLNAKIYTGDGTEPVLVNINQAEVTLDFSKFKLKNLYRS